MFLEYAENIVQLLTCLIALLFCLFQYISGKQKGWVYATAVFLCSLMSNYYWTAYLVIMGDYPNVSNLFSYLGWNVAFVLLLLLVLRMRCAESRRFFHPLMLLPIPLNAWQLTLYLQYGGVLNNILQVSATTAIACFSLQSILWYRRNRKRGAARPYVAMVALLYVFFEYGMWTTSCFAAPIGTMYYPLSFIDSLTLLALTWALALTYRSERSPARDGMIRRYQAILKAVYFAVMVVCIVGGIMLGIWMRDTMRAGLQQASESNLYGIIHVVLFVISLFLVAFAAAIIYVVRFSEKVAENNELSKARQIAEHSNEAKSEFLANMSHEIRTPINAVLGMNEIILRESRQARDRLPEPREAVQGVFADICNYAVNIQSAGNNLLSIINDILDFSKIEAGKLEIAEGQYRLSSVLNDVSNMIAFKARDKGLDFRVHVEDTLPDCLYGDEVRVRQIVTNVLNNAVKYTREGSVSLTVCGAWKDTARPGGAIDLKIVVEDTGVGIRQEDIGRLFEKFERADLRHNSTVEGTGLGLAITRNLLDMMGGSIDVQSVYGEGSVFTIVLPQKAVGTEPIGNFREKFMHSQEETTIYKESFHAPQARILVVDDTRMNLTVVVNLLKKTGIGIDTADSGEEAVHLSRSRRYDVILMDQRMPGMDGTEAMRRIREQTGGVNRETPFICLTADAVSGARERYLAEGFTDYLTKPIDSRALEQALIRHLPSGKVQVVEADQPVGREAEDGLGDDPFEALRAAGVDTEVGMRYSAGDPEMYRALLREYAGGAQERACALREYRDAGDWKNYATLAHALKSTFRMIGAAALSETAGRLEAAADAGQVEAIRQAHEDMIARYMALAGIIEGSLGTQARAAADDEILEFLPEGE